MTTIPPERVEKTHKWIDHILDAWFEGGADFDEENKGSQDALFAILDDYAAVKAENEAWKDNYYARLAERDKAEAELALEKMLVADLTRDVDEAHTELERQRPLVEAVMGATLYDSEAPGVTMLEFGEQAERAILRAALALREEKK